MQIILRISTFWRANSTILKIYTIWTSNRVFVLPSVYMKVKGGIEKRNIPQLITILFYFVDTVTIFIGFFGGLCLHLILPKYIHSLRTRCLSYPENKISAS